MNKKAKPGILLLAVVFMALWVFVHSGQSQAQDEVGLTALWHEFRVIVYRKGEATLSAQWAAVRTPQPTLTPRPTLTPQPTGPGRCLLIRRR